MPMIVCEQPLVRPEYYTFGFDINLDGQLDNDTIRLFNEENNMVSRFYRDSIKEIKKNKYFQLSVADKDYIGILTKKKWNDEVSLDLMVESLLAFDKDFQPIDKMGHLIDTLSLPAIGCGKDKLTWLEVEDILREKLKDTKVLFRFCIPTRLRVDKYSEEVIENDFYFKGDSILSVTGNYPFTVDNKEFKDVKSFIYYKMVIEMGDYAKEYMGFERYTVFLDNPSIDQSDRWIFELLSRVKSEHYNVLPNGTDINEWIIAWCSLAKEKQFILYPEFKEKLLELKEKNLIPVYCGLRFKEALGCGMSLDEVMTKVNDNEPWECHGYMGLTDILLGLIERVD